jgi:hypothetical protein
VGRGSGTGSAHAPPPVVAGAARPTTVSRGAASPAGPAVSDLYARADEALYGAKRAGWDRVCTVGGHAPADGGPVDARVG